MKQAYHVSKTSRIEQQYPCIRGSNSPLFPSHLEYGHEDLLSMKQPERFRHIAVKHPQPVVER